MAGAELPPQPRILSSTLYSNCSELSESEGPSSETGEDTLLSTKTLNGIYGFLSTWSTEDVGGGFEWSTKPGEEHVLPDDPARLLQIQLREGKRFLTAWIEHNKARALPAALAKDTPDPDVSFRVRVNKSKPDPKRSLMDFLFQS